MASAEPDAVELDDEERKALAEISSKGYYHGRPKNAEDPGTLPKLIDDEASNCTERVFPAEVPSGSEAAREKNAAPVVAVLGAHDQYVMLGASRETCADDLFRSYILSAVRVHPDRNPCPDAAEAFRRVAAALAELGDASSRWRYDQELQAGRGLLLEAGSGGIGCAHVPPQMTQEMAAQMFETAVTQACAEMNAQPAHFRETLLCAERLVAAAQAARAANGDEAGADVASLIQGLAFSAGLFVAGTAATMAGYHTIGNYARRVSLMQGVSQVAMGGVEVYKADPQVREKVDEGVAALVHGAQQVQSAAEDVRVSLSEQLAEQSVATSITAAGSAAASWGASVFDGLGVEGGVCGPNCLTRVKATLSPSRQSQQSAESAVAPTAPSSSTTFF